MVDAAETARALVYTGRGAAEIRPVVLPPFVEGMVEVVAEYGALSRGTERLVFEGRVPESEWQRMRAPFQDGAFPFPVKYGYATVGRVERGPDTLIGRRVFALYPHQTRFRLPAEAVVPVPDAVPAARAVLAANAETALNAIWDGAPAPGDRVLVVGAGLLGCLIAIFLANRAELSVRICDVLEARRPLFSDVNLTFLLPTEVPDDHVLAFHTSASAAGLETALDALAFEGTAVELSWYGDRPVPLHLGGAFHARRLKIVSSQVGHVAPSRRASMTHRDRLAAALALLSDPRVERLVTREVPFDELPGALAGLLAPEATGIATRIVYG
ncbi:MAG: zinc-binding alcohol dehydrogenase [Paracoccaceae bacterium]